MNTLYIGDKVPAGHFDSYDGNILDDAELKRALEGREALVYRPDSANLEKALRGGFTLAKLAADAGVRRFVLLSTLEFFRRHPRNWRMGPAWRPAPSTEFSQMLPWLAERSLCEVVRSTGLHAVVLRLGDDVSIDLVNEALQESLAAPLPDSLNSWKIRHVGDCSARSVSDGGRSWREVLAPPHPIASRPIKTVVIFGAGGPIAAALAQELAPHYRLILSDLRSLAEFAEENKPQSTGAPVSRPLPFPHEERSADIRSAEAVLAACEGADAIINCSVLRADPVDAFLVNSIGFHNICMAAVAHGIRRVVHTGPQMMTLTGNSDYSWDYDIACDAPSRPGLSLYGHSKYLGNLIGQVYAEWHDLEMPTLLFNHFAVPGTVKGYGSAMMLTFNDAARSIRAALEAPSFPNPYEEFHIATDFPHRSCRADKARHLLGWEPQDLLIEAWQI